MTRIARLTTCFKWVVLGGLALALFTSPAIAQGPGAEFCESDMAETIRNAFSVIQFGGPLIGGFLALGATVSMPVIRRSDLKKELKEMRTQGVVWGIIVAPLATVIIQFIMNHVVAGGTSCAF
ncbi:hypothetical protein [Haloarchaeobius iranensis]|uniref:hypothetical protein n=1 Tax=Haloarchaeobius iranensis TaxID=996166 RepID=UPI000B7D2B46|nr:hypothetical protein [Haloarchaeobius iranensis]